MKKRFVFAVVYLIAALISGGVGAYGQQSYAALLGQISDQNGAGVAGAKITVTSKETGLARTVTTDSSGSYRVGLLAAGEYSIKVEASGFGASEQADLVLRVGDERRVDVALRPGQVSASVTIEAPITDSATSTLSTVVPSERVNALPLNGRQLQELALTAPGVTASGGFRSSAFNQFGLATPTDGNAGAFNVNGAPSRANGFFLDGVDINVPEQGVIAFPPLIEATREFQIQTSLFNAEYGRFSGSIVSFVTKSGTNQWHGSVYEYFRNDALDANDFFNNSNGLPRTVLKQNQFGVTVGGPIHRTRVLGARGHGNAAGRHCPARRHELPDARRLGHRLHAHLQHDRAAGGARCLSFESKPTGMRTKREFRYVLQAGEGISVSPTLPIGQVVFVPREEVTFRTAPPPRSNDRKSRDRPSTSTRRRPASPRRTG